MTDKPLDVAIIGFGFAGLMTLVHLVENSLKPLTIGIFDATKHAGLGPAYATTRKEHLLNVRAGRMSAYENKPNDFYEWCLSDTGKNAAIEIGWDATFTPETFAPRAMYGAYLKTIYETTIEKAQRKHIHTTYINQYVTDIANDFTITAGDVKIHAMHIVVACGFAFKKHFGKSVIGEPWQFDFESLSGSIKPVALIGTGLTSVDTIMSLLRVNFKGNIIAISKRAAFPHSHEKQASKTPELSSLPTEIKLSSMLRYIKKLSNTSQSWQGAMDAIRPKTSEIWSKLTSKDQKRFFTKYFSLWNIHRHRMAPEIHDLLNQALANGQVKLKQGRVIRADDQGVFIQGQHGDEVIHCIEVFDCTGPTYGALPQCLDTLIQDGKILMHKSGIGLLSNIKGNISTDNKSIFAMGALLIGERLETTAVPELRVQAECVSNEILGS